MQSGIRPVIVLQNDIGNLYSPTTQIIPLTSKKKKKLPTHAVIPATKSSGLNSDSIALAEQITTISKDRLIRKVGEVDITEELKTAVFVSLGF